MTTAHPAFAGSGTLSARTTGPPVKLVFFNVSGDYQSADDPLPQSTTSAPNMEPVTGLVTFTPRVPKGFSAFVANYQISQNSSSQQIITLIGAITGGTFALEFSGVWTTPIAAGASATTVQGILQALSTIGTGNVTVTGANGGPWTALFTGALANMQQPQMTPDPTNLTTSSGEAAVTVDELVPGATSRVGPAAIPLPPRAGRIWTTGQLCSINATDSPGVELLSDMPELGITFGLIYDVTFDAVSYNDAIRGLAPFAFTAPTDNTPVCITDPALTKLPWQPPIQTQWYPGWTPTATPAQNVTPITRNWRTRAG
jgi:hypothetical protein